MVGRTAAVVSGTWRVIVGASVFPLATVDGERPVDMSVFVLCK